MSAVSLFSRPGAARSDVGRRIARCREETGISREALAREVGADPGYLRHVEEGGAEPATAALLRIATALGVPFGELRGRASESAPGRGTAAESPETGTLTPDECWGRLAGHGVGRIGMRGASGEPLILPVNYCVTPDGALAFRTRRHGVLAAAEGQDVAFEADRIDEVMSAGWNVLAVGRARRVTDSGEAERLDSAAFSRPWPDPFRRTWIVVEPDVLSGRRIRT
ncbi:pyridoxamine 5'-phosphate oxidase family protein [uncultured Streptomyces sp.]|uniref:helix-turn-helix domain-containing protein n=1 Tax=uncultured Streptomyces sp. TaxID=174707 RepID=UPI00260D9418|nr:pyridoxamine 5'-phosphate oxidase family protein [uncultured Streptomyces sp.]